MFSVGLVNNGIHTIYTCKVAQNSKISIEKAGL